jgi:hypothetical protein
VHALVPALLPRAMRLPLTALLVTNQGQLMMAWAFCLLAGQPPLTPDAHHASACMPCVLALGSRRPSRSGPCRPRVRHHASRTHASRPPSRQQLQRDSSCKRPGVSDSHLCTLRASSVEGSLQGGLLRKELLVRLAVLPPQRTPAPLPPGASCRRRRGLRWGARGSALRHACVVPSRKRAASHNGSARLGRSQV